MSIEDISINQAWNYIIIIKQEKNKNTMFEKRRRIKLKRKRERERDDWNLQLIYCFIKINHVILLLGFS